MRRTNRRFHDPGDSLRDGTRVRLGQVRQHDHREIELGIAIDGRLEALPRAGVADPGMVSLRGQVPAEPVGIRPAAVELDRRPG